MLCEKHLLDKGPTGVRPFLDRADAGGAAICTQTRLSIEPHRDGTTGYKTLAFISLRSPMKKFRLLFLYTLYTLRRDTWIFSIRS